VKPVWDSTRKKFCSHRCFSIWRIGKSSEWAKREPDIKVCPQCQKPFEAGGEGRPRRYQIHCSRACNVAAQGYRTECLKLKAVDAAYIAGFIDGEGCISFYKRGPSVGVKLFAHNNKRPVLDWISEVTGIGAVSSKGRPRSEKHGVGLYWQCNGKGAVSVLNQIREYLKIKGPQADLAIEAERLHQAKHFQDRPDVRDQFLSEIRRLNKRGPE
jgi:hypothetical protein